MRTAVGIGALAVLGVAASSASALPAGYAYEMVSPVDKNGGQAFDPNGAGGGGVSSDGERVAFNSANAFADSVGGGLILWYGAERRGTRWETRSMTPPFTGQFTGFGDLAIVTPVSEDMTKALVCTNTDPVTRVLEPRRNLYLRDNVSGTYTKLTPDPIAGSVNYVASRAACSNLVRAVTPTLSHLLIGTTAQLTQDAVGLSGDKIYLVDTKTAEIELASILPDGTAVSVLGGQGIAAGSALHHRVNVISEDGRIVYFQRGADAARTLYRRDVVTGETIDVAADPATGVGRPPVTFLDASRDGRYVFFHAFQDLVPQDTNGAADIYRWDRDAPPADRLTLVSVDDNDDGLHGVGSTGGGVGELGNSLGASQSGDRLYFVTTNGNQLVAGAPVGGTSKWYLWDDGVVKYVATDPGNSADPRREFHTNASASHFAFQSARGTGSGPALTQIYVYDADQSAPAAPDLRCASCLPGGPAATPWRGGFQPFDFIYSEPGVGLYPNFTNLTVRPSVADDGSVLFATATPLLPGDVNGPGFDYIAAQPGPLTASRNVDSYLYRDGDLELVSTGRSESNAVPFGMSPDGKTIAIATRERLSAWDVDDVYDVYVARRGGGLPEPVPAPVACQGDECQGPIPLPADSPSPGSSRFAGAGDASPAPRARLSVARVTSRQRARLGRRGRMSLRVRVNRPGRVAAVVKARLGKRSRVVARGSTRAGKAGRVTVALRLSKPARRSLANGHRLVLRMEVRFLGAASRRTLTLSQGRSK